MFYINQLIVWKWLPILPIHYGGMLIWRYTSRRIAMASGKTVPPRRGEMLDRETGEPVQNWSNQHAQTTCMTNAETGEVEQTPSSNIHSDRRRPFQVPKKALHSYQMKHQADLSNKTLELVNIFNDSKTTSEYYNTCNISPLILLLPTLFLFPSPAWLTVFCILIELCLHMWTHKTNKYCKDSRLRYRSPLHVLTSQFCALCKSRRNMQKISRLQDARALKVYSRKPKYCTYVERVSVVTWQTESHSSFSFLCCHCEHMVTLLHGR